MAPHITITIIIPTHNRHEKLAATVESLRRQSLPGSDYEIIVVDDGSTPPVDLSHLAGEPTVKVIRLEGVERSIARNRGAEAARGELLVFVDNDMQVRTDFLANYRQAHLDWPDAILVGANRLAEVAGIGTFAKFRQKLEDGEVRRRRGLVAARNFCAAGNMGISQERFLKVGGFDPELSSSEDQDFALRHTAAGGEIAFLPEAEAIHHDGAMDIRSYCRRNEWGAEHMLPFCERWPDWPDNIERERINGPMRWGEEPVTFSLRKVLKIILSLRLARESLFASAAVLQRTAPDSRALDRLYRLLLGLHIFRGYRRGRKKTGHPDKAAAVATSTFTREATRAG